MYSKANTHMSILEKKIEHPLLLCIMLVVIFSSLPIENDRPLEILIFDHQSLHGYKLCTVVCMCPYRLISLEIRPIKYSFYLAIYLSVQYIR